MEQTNMPPPQHKQSKPNKQKNIEIPSGLGTQNLQLSSNVLTHSVIWLYNELLNENTYIDDLHTFSKI